MKYRVKTSFAGLAVGHPVNPPSYLIAQQLKQGLIEEVPEEQEELLTIAEAKPKKKGK